MQTLTAIPFSGFYNSNHSAMLDGEAEMMTDENPNMLDDFSYNNAMLAGYCKLYVSAFNDLLPKGCKMEFNELISPREYNFTTDRIFCNISHEAINAILAETNEKDLRDVIRENCTSYSGFSSFYSPDRDDLIDWPLDVTTWEPAQLKLLLIAYLRSTDQEIDDYDMMEDARCNGHIASIVELGLPA